MSKPTSEHDDRYVRLLIKRNGFQQLWEAAPTDFQKSIWNGMIRAAEKQLDHHAHKEKAMINAHNKQFDALEGLSEHKQEWWLARGRVASTTARLSLSSALAIIGDSALESNFNGTADQCLNFGGRIITSIPMIDERGNINQDGWDDAKRIAAIRGFGEEIKGCCRAVIPASDQTFTGIDPASN